MQMSRLQAMSVSDCWHDYALGKLTRFECLFRDFLMDEISWPQYGAAEIIRLRERHSLTQEALGRLLGVSAKTVLRWETEGETVPQPVHIALAALDRMGEGIFELMSGTGSFRELESSLSPAPGLVRGFETGRRPAPSPEEASVPETFTGQTVRELRARLRMSVRDFAAALGVATSTVSKWESGEMLPRGASLTLMQILWQHGSTVLPKTT